jgi:SAM-dependent methyltransferase
MWHSKVIHLPESLNVAYEAILKRHGLMDKARQSWDAKAVYGGKSRENAEEHFAARFLNSVSRVQCVLIDPTRSFDDIPRDLLTTLSSHRISLLDIPCGAGAATLATLETLKELRKSGVLPTTPLSVNVIGADISTAALDFFHDQLTSLKPGLSSLGITVSPCLQEWDATDVQQTNDLLDIFLSDPEAHNEHLVLGLVDVGFGS